MNKYIVKDNKVEFLLVMACIASNISQLPFFVSNGITQYMNMPIWILLLIYLLFSKRLETSNSFLTTFFIFMFMLIGVLLLSVFTLNTYLNSGMSTCILISFFIYCLCELSNEFIDKESLKKISLAYSMSAIIVSIAIYYDNFSSGISFENGVYAYASKNSVSQIIFTSVIILMFTQSDNSRFIKILKIFGIPFQVFLLMILRSRATILGFFVCLIYIFFSKRTNQRNKTLIAAALILLSLVLIFNNRFREIFIEEILFASRESSDLDSLSSGRVSIISSFPKLINGHWLTGRGDIYFECFPLSAILNYGLIVGLAVLIFSYRPFFTALIWEKRDEYYEMFFIISFCYIINSLFEGLAPVGPGVKCYFMWLMFGLLSRGDIELNE